MTAQSHCQFSQRFMRPPLGKGPQRLGYNCLSLIVPGKELIYVARTRNGFVPASRRRVFDKLRPLITKLCPFVNLPETRKARWGEALTAEKMKKCVWVRPEIVAQVEFLEWTDADHLRHSKFAGLREDQDARAVGKERAGSAP